MLLALLSAAARGGQPALRVQVLRAEANGNTLDGLLRVEPPERLAEELTPADFAVYIAPAEAPPEEATQPRYRLPRLFLKRLHGGWYLDLRQLPAGVGGSGCQLVLRVVRGEFAAAHRIERLLGPIAEKLDVALLIDESLSMRRSDPERLRIEAAKTFVDLAYHSTRIARVAIVAFNHKARTLVPLTSLRDAGVIYQAIDKIGTAGQTDMDDALDLARQALDEPPDAAAKAVVLLTDGKDEPGRYRDAHRAFADRRWRVYTIGLSDRADHEVLRRIAGDTGGEYHEAPTNAELQEIFGKICLTLQRKVAIRSRALELETGRLVADAFPVDNTISAMTISLKARDPDIVFALRDPAGATVTPSAIKGGRGASYGRVSHGRKVAYQYYDVWGPAAGQWASQLQALRPASATVAVTAVTPLLLRAYPLRPSYYRGEPIELAASLALGDSVLADARVEARITTQDGRAVTIPLHDDGRHQDTGPDDGVFAGLFPGSEAAGQCLIRLVALGTTPAGRRFARELDLATEIAAEGHSRLWCSARALDLGVLYSGETATRSFDLKLTSALGPQGAETVRTELEPPASAHHRFATDALRVTPRPLRLETGELTPVTVELTVPPELPAGRYRGGVRLHSRYDRHELPIQVEVRRPKLVVDKPAVDLGAIESGGRSEAGFSLRLAPRGAVPARLAASDSRLSVQPDAIAVGPAPAPVRVSFRPPADLDSTTFQAKVVITTPLGKTELPITARVVKPSFAVSPEAIDFGELKPGDTAERTLTLRAESLQPQRASVAAQALAGQGATPALKLAPSDGEPLLAPGEGAAVALRLAVPAAQPPGAYRGAVTVATPLGKRTVNVLARVAATDTFRAAASLDFGKVAVGAVKEMTVELESLVAAEQRVTVSPPPPAPDWRLAAEPGLVVLPSKGKARVTLRLAATATAKPGQRKALVELRGPSRDRRLAVQAELFRPPHQSLAFDAPVVDVGRLQGGADEQVVVVVRSLVDEPQQVTVERAEAPAGIVGIEAQPTERTLPGRGEQALKLTLRPVEGPDEEPFEATVVVRGRSLPAELRVRGLVFTPPGTTFVVEPPVLDFGRVSPGEAYTRPLTIQSVYGREQKVSLGETPTAEGVALAVERSGALLPPGFAWRVPVGLAVSSDAPLGERRLAWEARGPGDAATFAVRVEVVAPEPPPAIARSRAGGIGWLEGVAIFLLLLLLLAALVAAYLLARWLIRSQRVPRMAKYFALSALVHAIVLFTALDLFVARQVKDQRLAPVFKVGLKAIGGDSLSGDAASEADALRARQERERQVDLRRLETEVQRLARERLAALRQQLDPSQAQLERPTPEERPELAEHPADDKKLSADILAELLEEIHDSEKARHERETRPDRPAETRTEHVARIREMTRAELEAAVRQALQPKATEAPKPTVAPDVPDLARPGLVEKADPKLEALVPAMEDLQHELAQGSEGTGELTARAVEPARVAAAGDIERGTAEAPRIAAAPARDVGEGPTAPRGREPAIGLLSPSERPARDSKATFQAFEAPQETVTPGSEAVGGTELPPRPGGGDLASRDVGVSRVEPRAIAERPSGAAGRFVATRPRPGATAPGPPAERPGIAVLVPAERPGRAWRRAAPPALGVPDEQPTVDALVRLPGSEPAEAAEPKPVGVAYQPGAGTPPVARPAMSASVRHVAATPALQAGAAPAERPGAQAPLPPAPQRRAAEKAPPDVPDLDEVLLVEGPLVAPRQHAPSQGREAQPGVTVVAKWQLQRRQGGRRGLAAAVGGAAPLAPRVATAGRPPGQVALAVDERAEGQRQQWLSPDGAPEETVDVAPGLARSAVKGEEAAGAVTVTRAAPGAQIARRGSPAAARAAAALGPRRGGAKRSPAPGLSLPSTREEPRARRGALELPAKPAEEAVESSPLVAARRPEAGIRERAVAPLAVPRGTRAIARPPTVTPRRPLAPREMALARAPGRDATGLLLPGPAHAAQGTGAVVGSETGGATRIVFTTIRYGSGEVDWDTHKTAMPFLAWQLRERIGFSIETRIAEVPLESSRVMQTPWIYMSGHRDFRFTDAQAASLRRYLLGGGTLWADDSTHEDDFTWDTAFRREVARALPPREGYRLRRITRGDDHPLFRSCFDLRQGYAGYWPPPGDKYRQNHIEGIEIDGRLAVIYTRNDYGDGLEIQPDTFPLKASLSGLSPAEMQESSFLMASNIVIYALTRGRGLSDQALLARAAESLRRNLEARRTQRDPYADAPATLLDDFSEPLWDVEETWEQAGSARLAYARRADPDAGGRRLAVTYQLDAEAAKVVLLRELPEERDLSGQDRVYVDVESRLEGGARLSLALITMPDWKYFESRPAFLKPGRNRVWFDLTAATWKTGEPVAEGRSEYCRRIVDANAVRRFAVLLYPVGRQGTVVLDRIELRAKPQARED